MPRPFTDFPNEAARVRDALEWLVLIAHVGSCHSLEDVHRELQELLETKTIILQGRRITCPGYNTLRFGLPDRLARLLFLSFRRPIDLFRMEGRRFNGLTDDARTAVQLALDYFETCDAEN